MTDEECEIETSKAIMEMRNLIAELEKEKCELLGIIQGKDKVIQELKKGNAELKGIKDIATLIRANNDTVITLMQLNNMLVSKNQQLTKAKEIIKDYLTIVKGAHTAVCGVPEENRTIHVLKLNEKAEEFLNSEVEQ